MFRYDGIYILTHNKNKIKVEGQYSPSLPLHRVFQGVGGGGGKGVALGYWALLTTLSK